ncbi:LysR family transcriptional regulator [Solidesulfovibrio sp.]|uniref:winged helix-turn-helix domain-containing protein n=1 Tax=Solidesulfovibrio sp. TaxID=2910990 RepID=UPI00261C6EE5|nr:LysR family transcriptional regulator [Solidesulfovibrio sp.]
MRQIEAVQRLHLWLETRDGMMLGLGRIQLLELVEELGSLNKAAAAMGMSYRAAWGRMKQTETVIGDPLVERSGPKKGFRLTPLGHEIVRQFRAWHQDVENYALARARDIFSWKTEAFSKDAPKAGAPD